MTRPSQVTAKPAPFAGIERPLFVLGMFWGATLFLSLVALILLPAGAVVGGLLAVLGTIYVSYSVVRLLLTKSRVLREQEISLWAGHAKMVSWNPTEGVIFLKNKEFEFVDDDLLDGGGIRVIYPLLGEELVMRVPLEVQTLTFRDTDVLTKEYMPLTIQGTIYWKVTDLRSFYLYISKEVHKASDTGAHSVDAPGRRPQLEVAEQWLRLMAEETTRSVVSRIGTGLLIADQLVTDLPKTLPEAASIIGLAPQSSATYRTVTDSLAETIRTNVDAGVRNYGIDVHRVQLQEVKLPPEIYAAAVDACKSAYLPLKAHAEGLSKKLSLQAEADVLGTDALALREIAGNIPAFALQDFLGPMFLEFSRRHSSNIAPAVAAATVQLATSPS
jgi:regulator of protease activity HflC (stomatin/prohibitin superfamily)